MSKLNLTEAGRRLSRSRTTIRKMINDGTIIAEIDPANGRLVIDESEIRRFMSGYIPYCPPHKAELSQPSER